MSTIVGLDISSFQINACLLRDGEPPVLRAERLGKSTDPLIERLREVPAAIDALTWFYSTTNTRPDWVVIEDCFGRNRNADRALNRVVGAIVASVPAETQIAIVSTGDWRRALGAKNTKEQGHQAVKLYAEHRWLRPFSGLDEHELDACGVALAWSEILAANAETAIPDEAPQVRGARGPVDTLSAEKSAPAERELPEAWQPRPEIGTA